MNIIDILVWWVYFSFDNGIIYLWFNQTVNKIKSVYHARNTTHKITFIFATFLQPICIRSRGHSRKYIYVWYVRWVCMCVCVWYTSAAARLAETAERNNGIDRRRKTGDMQQTCARCVRWMGIGTINHFGCMFVFFLLQSPRCRAVKASCDL